MLIDIVFCGFFLIMFGVVFFNFGPEIIEWFYDTLDRWRDIILDIRDRRANND